MNRRRLLVSKSAGDHVAQLRAAFDAIRDRHQIPQEFPPAALAEAHTATTQGLPPWEDLTDLPLVTVDPPGSRDLDQALHLERDGEGFLVYYAIAAVSWWVKPGGALDEEARARGCTVYIPDGKTPLHPPVLSEGVASLLPGQITPAFVWQIRLNERGEVREGSVSRALVRSQFQFDYSTVHRELESGTAHPVFALLRVVGALLAEQERKRGGASLVTADQEVEVVDGRFELVYRPGLPIESWNAHISLLTGMVAADKMEQAGIGVVRTLPVPTQPDVESLKARAKALGVTWPDGLNYGEFLRTLTTTDPTHVALHYAATSLFRGADYRSFVHEPAGDIDHGAIAAPYAHVTAPLRRLVDRFALEVCAALDAGEPVPAWVEEALPGLPEQMRAAHRRAAAVDRECVDVVEVAAVQHLVGEELHGIVVADQGHGTVLVQMDAPAVVVSVESKAKPGERITVRVVSADLSTAKAEFAAM